MFDQSGRVFRRVNSAELREQMMIFAREKAVSTHRMVFNLERVCGVRYLH